LKDAFYLEWASRQDRRPKTMWKENRNVEKFKKIKEKIGMISGEIKIIQSKYGNEETGHFCMFLRYCRLELS
jgi:hypothetical protein